MLYLFFSIQFCIGILFNFIFFYIILTFSALFGNQPDIVKPSLSSRLGPPQPTSQSAVEKEGDDEEEGEWDGEEEELGEEEEEVEGGEEEEDGGEGDDYGEEESKIETTNEPPALEVEPPKYELIMLVHDCSIKLCFPHSVCNPLGNFIFKKCLGYIFSFHFLSAQIVSSIIVGF